VDRETKFFDSIKVAMWSRVKLILFVFMFVVMVPMVFSGCNIEPPLTISVAEAVEDKEFGVFWRDLRIVAYADAFRLDCLGEELTQVQKNRLKNWRGLVAEYGMNPSNEHNRKLAGRILDL